ncbi:putative transfer origin protein, TraL [Taylorella equigenitalis ATCC 35865]|uniref:Transfer origin protein, TraL n=2 Tax=Taylorella equigenitalis TaxID=29575 RepID=A0ABN4AW01_9BURK|nr:putative transfer origin protein, TraL [Taylorella equigenitalis ATCC 35865]
MLPFFSVLLLYFNHSFEWFFYGEKMKQVHIVLQGKGGVGKSLVALVLAQYLKDKGNEVICFDADPVNQTLYKFPSLNVKLINLLKEDGFIDNSSFDSIFDELLKSSEDTQFVIDNGSGSFIPLISYLKENEVQEVINTIGAELVFHIPIIGGGSIDDTSHGLMNILTRFNYQSVIWINEFFGQVIKNEKSFENWSVIKNNQHKIKGLIFLKKYSDSTFGKDISKMTTNNLTFDEVDNSSDFPLMSKQRIKTFKKNIYQQLDPILGGTNYEKT